jgi:hypothetical protein
VIYFLAIVCIGLLLSGLNRSPIRKGGYNDLRRWKAFGGELERPAPPTPIIRAHREIKP